VNKSNLRNAASVGVLIVSLGSASAALAQEAEPTTVGEIVVTANRREQSVLDVPYNVSAVSGTAIEDAKIADSAELMRGVPGVSVVDRGYRNAGVMNNVLIRGINVDSNALGDYAVSSVAPVSTYLNETPVFAGFLLKDLERVEVLRGPQGTLYGSGSLGGTVRYITRAPKLGQFEGAANVTSSSVEGSDSIGWTGDLTFNVPLGDTLAFRATFSRIDLPGLTDYVNLYVLDGTGAPAAPSGVLSSDAAYTSKKDADTVEISFARLALRWEPTDGFDATLTYSQQSDEIGGRRQVTRGFDGYGNRYGEYENGSIQLEPSSRDVSLLGLEMNVDLGFATLTSSVSHYEHTGDSVSENTGRYASAHWLQNFYYNHPRPMASAVRGYSDEATIVEVRLVSKAGDHFDYVVGGFYNDDTLVATQDSYLRGFKRWWDIWSGFPSAVASDQDFIYRRREEFTDKALFGELTWHVSETLSVTGGVRWFDNEAVNNTFMDVPVWTSLSQPVNARFASGESKALFKGNLAWTFSDDGLFYATVSEGYRRGGSNAVPLTGNFAEDARWQTYTSDSVLNYEAGIKGRMGGIVYDAALFYVDWDNIQLNVATPNWGFYAVQNGGKARTMGLESSIDGRPTESLHYSVGYTYTDAALSSDVRSPLGGLVAADGSKLPGTPEHAITVSGDYSWDLEGDVRLVARFSGYYQSETRNAIGSALQNTELPAFQIWNASTTVSRGGWGATLFVKNIFNDDGITGELTEAYMGTAPAQNYYGNGSKKFISLPRTIGLSLDYSF